MNGAETAHKTHFGTVALCASMLLSLLFIYLADTRVRPDLPAGASWGALSGLGSALLIFPCFLAGLFLGQLLAVCLYWLDPANHAGLRRYFGHLSLFFGKTNVFKRDLPLPEMAGKQLLAFLKVLALFLAIGYVGVRDVYYLAPDGAHVASVLKGDRAYPWAGLSSVAVDCVQSHRGGVLTCVLSMQDGGQVELVQGNAEAFKGSLPALRYYLAQAKGVRFSSSIDPRTDGLVQRVFGTADPSRFFKS